MFKRKFVFLSSMKEKEQIQNHLPQRNFLGENYQFAFGIFYSTSPLSSFTDNNCIWNTDNICLYNTDNCCICKNDKGRGKKKTGKKRLGWPLWGGWGGHPPPAWPKLFVKILGLFSNWIWFLDTQNRFYFIVKRLKNAFLMYFQCLFNCPKQLKPWISWNVSR